MDEQNLERAFYTPYEWVDKSHQYMEYFIGNDWKERNIWDCCCGKGALTSGYSFDNLFLSTLNDEDINYVESYNFNLQNNKFQFDFLNDDLSYLPSDLKEKINNNEEIIFFINPPFGKVKVDLNLNRTYKNKRGQFDKTFVSSEMEKNENFGKTASSQFYIQFIYRIMMIKDYYNLTNIKIGMFAPPFFLSGSSFKKFRKKLFQYFQFEGGFLMNANDFNQVGDWRLSFSIFNLKPENDKNNFIYDVLQKDNEGNICFLKEKNVYNTDGEQKCNDWAKEFLPSIGYIDAPQLSSALKVKEKGKGHLLKENCLGYFYNDTNYIKNNLQGVALFSSAFNKGLGCPVTIDNLTRVIALFMARKGYLHPKWYEMHDEYIVPDCQNDEEYIQWNNDCFVYSIFNNKSFQTSLRNIQYKEQLWDIKNEFFWVDKEKVEDLANKFNYNDMQCDLQNEEKNERIIQSYINNLNFSSKAQQVLDYANFLFEESFPQREEYAYNNPKCQLYTWDAGYAQLKWLWKRRYKSYFKEFRRIYYELEDQLFPYVYKFGFLKK